MISHIQFSCIFFISEYLKMTKLYIYVEDLFIRLGRSLLSTYVWCDFRYLI